MKKLFIFALLTMLLLSGCQLNKKQADLQKQPADVFQQTINKAKSTANHVNEKSSKLEKSFPFENE